MGRRAGISCYLTPSCNQGFCIPNTPQWFGVAAVSMWCGSGTGTVGMAREMDVARELGGGCPGAQSHVTQGLNQGV